MHLNASEAVTYAEREHIGVELDVDALARGQMNIRLQETLGVGRIHKPALIEVVDKTQLRQHAKLVVHLGCCGVRQRAARQTIESCSRSLAIEIGVGQTQRNIRSERRVRLIEAVLQQQGRGIALVLPSLPTPAMAPSPTRSCLNGVASGKSSARLSVSM